MSAEDAFLDALLADPMDFETRLVFADWLEERGDPRGEFLRVQTELARWVPNHRRRNELLTRERQLLADHEVEWLGPLREFCDEWRWEGGLAHITLLAARFVDQAFGKIARDWLRRAWVRTVEPCYLWPRCSELAACEHLRWVTALDLHKQELRDETFRELLFSPHLERLTHLKLANCREMGPPRALAVLCNSPVFKRLRWLDLRNMGLGVEISDLLVSLEKSQLCWLDLHGNDIPLLTLRGVGDWQNYLNGRGAHGFMNSIGMDFTLIPCGSFLLGSPESEAQRYEDEGPLHEVTLTRPFYLGVYAVTQNQYQGVMGANPSHFNAVQIPWESFEGVRQHPVESVSWRDAVEFCRRLSERPEEKKRGRVYRLPTEAEWEHACRAGGAPELPFHCGRSFGYWHANFNGQFPYGAAAAADSSFERTVIVGYYKPNAFGLYDMHGNVWEWCADGMDHTFYSKSPPVDPVAPHDSDQRVCRGGSWFSPGHYCRSADRGSERLDLRDRFYGFRVACDLVGPS